MTLKQAITQWGSVPKNTVLAATGRDAIRAVLAPHDCQNLVIFDREYVQRLFGESEADLPTKVTAANILVNVLAWASKEEKACPAPDFTTDIAKSQPATPKEPRPATAARACTQLDPVTLKPIASFRSAAAANASIGGTGVYKAIAMHTKAGGFYWCVAGEEESFCPAGQESRNQGTTESQERGTTEAPKDPEPPKGEREEESESPQPSAENHPIMHRDPLTVNREPASVLSDVSDADLIAEMRRRGWRGDIELKIKL